MKHPLKRNLIVLLAMAAVLLVPLAAQADLIPVSAADFTGSRSTPDASGVVAADGWTAANGGFKVTWAITQEGPTFHYSYTFSNADGSIPTTPDVSHLILEVSPNFTVQDILNPSSGPVVGPTLFTAATAPADQPGDNGGNPNLPKDIFGIKLDWGASTYSFDSPKSPVWGDFYTKDGKDDGLIATAWNTGIGTDPTLATTDFTNWIPVPDTTGVVVPLPPTALLMGFGLVGLGLLGWRRKSKN